MILNAQQEILDVSVKITVEGKVHMIFISSESARCFACGEFGQVRQACPRGDPSPSQREEECRAPASVPNTEYYGRADTTPSNPNLDSGAPQPQLLIPLSLPSRTVPAGQLMSPAWTQQCLQGSVV